LGIHCKCSFNSLKTPTGKEVINPNMRQGMKSTPVDKDEAIQIWKNLRETIPSNYKYAWYFDE
jgi:hypothetical protein